MKKKTEAKFLSELKAAAAKIDRLFWLKIPDMPAFQGSKTRFSPPKPFDVFFIYKGRPFCIEAKTHVKYTAWPFSAVREHQVEALKEAARAGAIAEVLVNCRQGRGKSRINFVANINIQTFLHLRENMKRKSLTISDLYKYEGIHWSKFDDEWQWNLRGYFLNHGS